MKATIAMVWTISAAAAMMLSAGEVPACEPEDCLPVSVRTQDGAVRQKNKPRKEYRKAVFSVSMHCENCVRKIQDNIAFEKGVKALDVSLDSRTVSIEYDPEKTDADTLAAAIEKLGYEVKEISPENI